MSLPTLQNKKRVIGVDPGFGRIGVAVLEYTDASHVDILFSDCIETNPRHAHEERIRELSSKFSKIIQDYAPEELAIEKLYFGKNSPTALKVAEARGVILACAPLQVFEYHPSHIKIALTGYGRAEKSHIKKMIDLILSPTPKTRKDDEYDALAVAYTHTCQRKLS